MWFIDPVKTSINKSPALSIIIITMFTSHELNNAGVTIVYETAEKLRF